MAQHPDLWQILLKNVDLLGALPLLNRLALELPSPHQILCQTLKLDLLTQWSLEKWVRSRLSFPELCVNPMEHQQLLEAAAARSGVRKGAIGRLWSTRAILNDNDNSVVVIV